MSFDDEFIRSQVAPDHEAIDAHAALASLKPAMRHARRRRHAALGALTAALVGAGVLGVVALNTATNSPDLRNSTVGEVLPTPDTLNDIPPTSTSIPDATSTTRPPDDSLVISATTPGDVIVTTTKAPNPPTTTERSIGSATSNPISANPPATTSSTRPRPVQTTTPPRSTVAPTPTPTSAPTPTPTTTSTSTPTSTSSPPTTTPPPIAVGRRTLTSTCGSVTVDYSGESVTLLSTQPNSGFAVDIKKSGPDEVEVEFNKADAECRIKAKMESGNLEVSIDND